MSLNFDIIHPEQVERAKLNRKIFYHFAIFIMINEILITKNRKILIFNNFLLKYYHLYRKTARDKNCLFFSYKVLRIFFRIF